MPGERNSFIFIEPQVRSRLQSYPWPRNVNFLWKFGSLVGISLVVQIVTGLFAPSRYISDVPHAFADEQHIREVSLGWEFGSAHSTGASGVFLCLFLHILSSLVFSSYIYLSRT